MFDSGSQRSYVSEKLARQLKLEATTKETVNLNTFGSTKYSKFTLNSVVVNVVVENNETIPVTALTHNVICTPVSPRINVENFPHLYGLSLADCFEDRSSKSIDLLIDLIYLDTKKASPIGSIPAKIIKDNADIVASYLLDLFNKSVHGNFFPDEMKDGDASALFKNSDSFHKKNYRPITVLPSVSKVF